MKKLIINILLFLCFVLSVSAQDAQPQAQLRVTFECPNNCDSYIPQDEKYYSIEILMPQSLKEEVYNQLINTPNSNIAVLFDKKIFPNLKMQVSPKDEKILNKSRRLFVIYVPKSEYDTIKNATLYFYPYPVDENEQLIFPAIPIGRDFTSKLGFDSYNRKVFEQRTESKKSSPFVCEDSDAVCNNESLIKNFTDYKTWRLKKIDSWYQNQAKNNIELRIEDTDKCIKANNQPCEQTPSPTLSNLPVYDVVKTETIGDKNFQQLRRFRMQVNKELPTNFNVAIKYLNTNDVPFEIKTSSQVTEASLDKVEVASVEDDRKVGNRDVEDNLSVAFLLGSSVEDVEKDINGVNQKVRERKNQGTLDLWFKPFGTKRDIFPQKSDSGKSSGLVTDWTPFFLDAKVSTGKITKDTLSLNRIAFGTSFNFDWFINNNSNSDYISFIAKAQNLSDRDFKQAEYVGTFEIQPILSFLNRPKEFQFSQKKVIIDPDDEIADRKYYNSFRYKFIPFVGGEIGRVWRRKNPATAIELSDTVKRLYVGFDSKTYLSDYLTLSLVDTLYFNYGKNVDKKVNYFNGELDFKLRRKTNFGDSFFISFERGQQPPFDTPSVNAFKIGYRFVTPSFTLFK